MTNSEFYDYILKRVRRDGDTVVRADVILEVTRLMQSWEKGSFHPWFLETVASGLVTVADTQTISEPTDYGLLIEDTDVFVVDEDGDDNTLERGYHENLENKYANEDAGLPKTYDFFGGLIYFGPVPDAVYTIKLKYYANSTVPPDDNDPVTNPWVLNAEDYCITAAAERIVRYYLKNSKLAGELKLDLALLRKELFNYSESRKHVDMNYEVDS